MKQPLLLRFIFWVVFVAAVQPGRAQTTCEPTAGLVARFPFDDGQGAAPQDATGQVGAGTLTGGTWYPGGGYGGGALALTGSDHLSIPLNWQPAAFSYSFWVYPVSFYTGSQGTGGEAGWGSFVFQSTSEATLNVGTDQATALYLPLRAFLRERTWQHFVFTFANGVGTLYKNGLPFASKAGMTPPGPWQGVGLGGPAVYDELRIYDRAVSPQEARNLYQCGGPPGPPPPLCSTAPVQVSPNTTVRAGQAATLQARVASPPFRAALQFEGDADLVLVSSPTAVPAALLSDVVNNFTVEAWVNPSAPHDIDGQDNFSTGGTFGQRYLIFPTYGGAWGEGHAGMGISVGSNGVSVYEHAAYYMPPVLVWQGAVAGWTHLAVVYRDRHPTLYINGQPVAQGVLGPKAYVHPSLNIGGGVYGHYQGQANEVRIWSEARTAAQIQALYQQVVTAPAPTLAGCWHLDEGSGSAAADASGHQLTGTLTKFNVGGFAGLGYGPQWQVPSTAPITPGVAYSWSPAAGLDRTDGPTVVASPTVNTTYTVTATGATGCASSQATVTVTVPGSVPLPPDNPDYNRERNWTLERSFDGNGNVIAESKQFTDALGRPTQAQARNAATQQVFAAQTVYSTGGQPVLQTLAAPINNQSFNYQENFVTAGGQPYGPANFEDGKASQPDAVDAGPIGTLGHYFSQLNETEPLTPITGYPYSLMEPYEGPLGGTKRAAGPGDELRMGKGREGKGRDFPLRKEFDHYVQLRPQFVPGSPLATLEYQGMKSVSVNADGRESIAVTNKEGQALVSCLSGPQYPGVPVAGFLSTDPANPSDPNAPVYQDVHIPAAGPQEVTFTPAPGQPGGSVRVVNLLTDATQDYPVASPDTRVTLAPGFYRFVALGGTQQFSYLAHYGNFSYTYYDDAGRVVATVAPNGVDLSSTAAPQFTTRNTYDTSGRLLATESTDEGRTEYVYARDGRIRFSQSALQQLKGRFSYSNYDAVDRVVESGEYTPGDTAPDVFEDHLTPAPGPNSVLRPEVLESRAADGGISAARCAQRNQVWYDLPWDGAPGNPGQDHQIDGRTQEFVLGAVAKTQNDQATTWYSYDELGRVTWVVQDIQGVGVKTLDYTYDFSGNVLEVAYQNGQPDGFHHYYTYDAAQRLVAVATSPDGTARTLQASYSYYLHGPLKRVELANGLQGVDYTYTLQGWLKGINDVNQSLDPGGDTPTDKDGKPKAGGIPKDLFGMTLDYFSGDYLSRARPVATAPDLAGTPAVPTRYDGTIRLAAWRTAADPNAHRQVAYEYDEKSQLKQSTFGQLALPGLTGPARFLPDRQGGGALHEGGLSYDANGNLKTLQRTNQLGAVTDNFAYHYKPNTNQLESVRTGDENGLPVLDYDYDALGQMTRQKDEQGQRYLAYDVTGKTTGVYADEAHAQPLVTFAYDDRGFRVRKTAYPAAGSPAPARTTYYVRDVAGNILAVYDQAAPNGPVQRSEVPLYGSGRLGTLTRLDDGTEDYRYELTDHLGNARVVFHRPTTVRYDASMETEKASQEEQDFTNVVNTRFTGPFNHRAGQHQVSLLGMYSGQPTGPGKVLTVQKGDTITFSAYAWLTAAAKAGTGQPRPNGFTFAPILISGAGNAPTGENSGSGNPLIGVGVGAALALGGGGSFPGQLNALDGTTSNVYLRYRVLDENGQEITRAGGAQEADGARLANWQQLQVGLRLQQAGTVELSVEVDGLGPDVFVDDVAVEQTGGMIVQEQHQYAFGAPLPGLSYTVGNKRYRYGYQGQYAEHDAETGWENFELRLYNSRVGRWMSYDPEGQFDSPYVGMGNDPISRVDPNGGFSPPFLKFVSNTTGLLKGSAGVLVNWGALASVGKTVAKAAPYALQSAVSMANTAARAYGQYAFGVADAVADDLSLGVVSNAIRGGGPAAQYSGPMAVGQFMGHGGSAVAGLLGAAAGYGGEAGGGALSFTGGGAIAGVPIALAGAAGVGYGTAVTTKSLAGLAGSGRAVLNMAGKTLNQLQKLVEKKNAPPSIDRFDKGIILGEQDHVHFKNGAALNIDGTWKHGFKDLTKAEKIFLKENGWTLPE